MAVLSRPTTLAAAFLLAASSSSSSITVHAQEDCASNLLQVAYPAPVAADGWEYRLVAQNLTRPRGILFDADGALLVVDRGEGIKRFEIEDNGGTCVSVGEPTVLTDDEDLNHGIALSEDGETLYASTENDVYSWPYSANVSSLDADNRRTLITNMSNTDHTTRTLLAPRKQPGIVIVSRGSDSNEDADAERLDSGHSQIRSFNVSSLDSDSDPMDFMDGDVLGWGLRNSVGVAEEPNHGGIWSVENSVDEMHRNGQDIHTDNPGEELNFHGFANGSAGYLGDHGVGANYGYPLCYAIWGTENFPDLGDLETGDQFPGEETSSLTDASCNGRDYVSPRLTFQAHTAPLDIKFTKDGSQAFISFHGSWNREDPTGYKISSIAFNDDGMPAKPSSSRDAAVDVLTTPDLGNCPDECFRPVGLAWDSEGRLWVSSDSTGEIFILRRTGGGGGNGNDGGNDDGGDGDGGGDDDEGAGASLIVSKVAVALGALIAGALLA